MLGKMGLLQNADDRLGLPAPGYEISGDFAGGTSQGQGLENNAIESNFQSGKFL